MSIQRFLYAAGSPLRLRASLRHETRLVRRMFDAAHQLDTLPTSMPVSLLGGDMLSLLSNRLRALLTDEAAGSSLLAAVPASRMMQTPETEHLGHAGVWEEPNDDAAYTGKPVIGDSPQIAQRGWTGDVFPPERTTASDTIPEHQHFSSASLWESSTIQSGAAHTWREQDPETPRAKPLTPADPLRRALDTYWQLDKAERNASRHPEISGSSQNGKASVQPSSALVPLEHNTHWSDLVGQQVRQRTMLPSSRIGRQKSGLSAGENVEIQNVFNIEMKNEMGLRAEDDFELAETIAEILREQALQHGIDLT